MLAATSACLTQDDEVLDEDVATVLIFDDKAGWVEESEVEARPGQYGVAVSATGDLVAAGERDALIGAQAVDLTAALTDNPPPVANRLAAITAAERALVSEPTESVAEPMAAIIAIPGGLNVINGTAGNDTLTGTVNADQINGLAGTDTLIGNAGADVLDGGTEIDTASYTTGTVGVTVNLTTNTATGGDAAGDTFVSIENLRGSNFDDSLTGDAAANQLLGATGNDTLVGNAGKDTLVGGLGADVHNGGTDSDTASYGGATTGVAVDLVSGGTTGEATGDTFVAVENLRGSAFDDSLSGDGASNVFTGAAGADTMDGRGGDDSFVGGDGADTITGGAGRDISSYSSSTVGVIVNLTTGAGTGGEAAGDVLSGVENLRGSEVDDRLTGDAFDNDLTGGAGNDIIVGNAGSDVVTGGLGADNMQGNSGSDFVVYQGSVAGVTVNLTTSTGSGGDAAGDIISGFENVIGSSFNDTLTGNGIPNIFDGGPGSDVIDGAGAADRVEYTSRVVPFTINLGTGTATGGGETDTLISIENVFGGQANDNITGSAGVNIISGQEGNDTLNGGAGSDEVTYVFRTEAFVINLATGTATSGAETDTLSLFENATGGFANDTIIGTAGINILQGGAGADTIDGGGGADLLTYNESTAGISVSLLAGTGTVGDATGDIITNMEDVRGSSFADTIVGNDLVNVLTGGNGPDTLSALGGNDSVIGGEGADALDCGLGVDLVVYSAATTGVSIDLTAGTGTGGEAAGDTFIACEGLRSSEFADTLVGDAGINTFTAAGGDDILDGRGGNDSLLGGTGNNTFIFQPGMGKDIIVGFQAGGVNDVMNVAALGIQTFAQIQARTTQPVPGRTLITFDAATSITLIGITPAQLTAADFIFAP